MANANNLEEALNTSVKFYASLTRNQAKGLEAIGKDDYGADTFVEPGAICFVSDSSGNSIFLNNRLFGDGATAGSISGGGGSGSGGLTEVHLSDIVVVEADGEILTEDKTLDDYFDSDGKFITDYLIVNTTVKNSLGEDEVVTAVSIDASGIKINNVDVATTTYVTDAIANAKTDILAEAATEAQSKADSALESAKSYADTIISSVYKVKGSVLNYESLTKIESPKTGDVYNVINAQGSIGSSNYIPPGTNFVYVDDGTNQYWDPLGGTVDLSNYATSTDVSTAESSAISSAKDYTDSLVSTLNTAISNNTNSISTLSGTLTNLNSTVVNHTTAISTNTTNIETNTTNITNISTLLTWQ